MSVEAESDGRLLGEFAATRGEAVFEELVRRHGALVFGACYRVLGHRHDAEDATQAVFLTLAQRAHALRGYRSVAAWLHQVAWNISARFKASKLSRARRERAAVVARTADDEGPAWEQLCPWLDHELAELAERHRLPLILHHIEGRTQQEVAQLMGCTAGTLSRRLGRAEELLRERLRRRGVTLSPAIVFAVIAKHAAVPVQKNVFEATVAAVRACVPGGGAKAAQVSTHVITLSEGALRAMYLAKLRIAAAVVIVCALGAAMLAVETAKAADAAAAQAKPTDVSPAAGAPVTATRAESIAIAKPPGADAETIDPQYAGTIAQLGSEDLDTRLAAMDALRKAGAKAGPALQVAAARSSENVKARAAILLGVLNTAPKVQQVLTQIKSTQSYSADVECAWMIGGAPVISRGSIKADVEKRLFVADLAMDWGMNLTSHAVCDGKAVWIDSTMPAPGPNVRHAVTKTPLDAGGEAANPANVKNYADICDLTGVRVAMLGDTPVYVFDGVMREDYRRRPQSAGSPLGALMADQYSAASRCTITVGKQDGVPRKIEMTNEQQNMIVINTFSNIRVGAPLDPNLFSYSPPPNIHVVDMTSSDASPAAQDDSAAPKGSEF